MLTDLFDDSLESIRKEVIECTKCPLSETRINAVPGDGNRHARLMFIGEAPGAAEDEVGKPFVGRSGKLLTEVLKTHGIERSEVFISNIVKCRPPQNRDPKPLEIKSCTPYLLSQIDLINPSMVCVLGRYAAATLLSRPVKITQEHGQWLEFANRALLIALHPSAALRSPKFRELFEFDIQQLAVRFHNKSV